MQVIIYYELYHQKRIVKQRKETRIEIETMRLLEKEDEGTKF